MWIWLNLARFDCPCLGRASVMKINLFNWNYFYHDIFFHHQPNICQSPSRMTSISVFYFANRVINGNLTKFSQIWKIKFFALVAILPTRGVSNETFWYVHGRRHIISSFWSTLLRWSGVSLFLPRRKYGGLGYAVMHTRPLCLACYQSYPNW